MAYTKLGRIRPVYKGTWSASAAYTALEMVKSADGKKAYIAVKDVPKGTALTNAAYWGVVLDVSDVLDAADEAIAAAVARADEAAASANEAAALAPKPLELAESAQPAQIWPEEGSPLRPVISMLPAQTGSGDPSPENVRPISGHEAVMVTRCGRNLLPTPNSYEEGIANGLTWTKNADGSVTLNGTVAETAPVVVPWLWRRLPLPAGRYILSGFHDTASYIYATTFNRAGETQKTYYAYTDEIECIVPDGGSISVTIKVAEGATYNNRTIYPMLRLASDMGATYEPYRGDVYSISLGQTVYGGTLDAAKGELLVDTCGIVFNGTENISLQENYNNTGTNRFSYAGTPVPVQESTALCSHMTFGYSPLGANNTNNRIAVWKNGGLYWRFDRCATVSEMKAYFTEQYNAGTPVKVVYALAEPYTVKLAPVTIPALEGLNTVTSAGESMTLTYNKSLVREHGEIMARLAALEAAALGNT